MKKIISIIMLLLTTQQAIALDGGSFEVKVTINKAPDIADFQPADGYTITEGNTLNISVDATDPNNDTLQYQFKINDVIKRLWGADPQFSYTLLDNDIGLNKILIEVTDGIETIETDEIEIFVFRKLPDLPTVQQ